MEISEKLAVYLASGWFTPRTREILEKLESYLETREDIELYSPRRDGVVLPPEQKHDTSLRESIFNENIKHIIDADLLIANIDSVDSYNDPGTVYEIGYAMANNIPVIGYSESIENLDRFTSISPGFETILFSIEHLALLLDDYSLRNNKLATPHGRVLFVGTGNDDIDDKIVSYISESGFSVRVVNEKHNQVYSKIEEIFDDIDYMIAVIDDRKSIVSWMIGQAHARHVPIVTYSDFNWGINVMLLVSVLTHIRGTEELRSFLQKVRREGLYSIPKFDISQLDSM